jgi:transposase
MWNQKNSKVTENYLKKLKSKLEHQNDLTAVELRSQLLLEMGIDITERRVQQILKDLRYTKKRKTLFMRMLIFQSINKEPRISFILMI